MEQALQLASFILRDRGHALAVTASALSQWQTSIVHKKKKRSEYDPKGRFINDVLLKPFRTKLTPNEPQELQLLVLAESEKVERKQEKTDSEKLTDEDFIIRYVKHLSYLTTTRNSFYVMLGVCRLLHDYPKGAAMDVYEAVVQDADRQREETYHRKRRLVLMNELKKRFGEKLQLEERPGRETRFVKRIDSTGWFALIKEALELLTLWETPCILPATFKSSGDPIPSLAFNGSRPDEAHPVEARRMHTLLHPPCFEKLTTALRLAPPAQSLGLPQFAGVNSDDQPRKERRLSPSLQPEERETIKQSLKRNVRRRKDFDRESVVVKVDSLEICRVELNRPGDLPESVRTGNGSDRVVEVDHTGRLLEIVGNDDQGELILGSLMLTLRHLPSAGTSESYSLQLGRGREISFDVTARADEAGEYAGASLAFDYRERPWAAIPSKVGAQLSALTGVSSVPWTPAKIVRLAVSSSFVLAIIGLTLYFSYRHTQRPTNLIASVEPTAAATPITHPTSPNVSTASDRNRVDTREHISSPSVSERAGGATSRYRSKDQQNKRASALTASEGTRSLSPDSRASLAAVKRIYIESHPGNAVDADLREELIHQLAASARFTIVDDLDKADALLLWSNKKTGVQTRLSALLVDKQQRILWRDASKAKSGDSAVELLVKGLLTK